ncbi:ankyrin repeat domain-containing protein [Pandoraea apista]|nr:ankyrin repeat domain-containing protein [Pandoraea apista]
MPQSPLSTTPPVSSAVFHALPATSPEPGNPSPSPTLDPSSLSEMSLDRLLLAKRDKQCSSKDARDVLISVNTTAGRELLDSCRVARDGNPAGLAFTMATLFCTPPQERTLARLDEAGIFVDRTRRRHLRPDDANLLLSDEGLQLWLRFAASPSAYPSVFVDSILNETSGLPPEGRLASALKVLVLSGRDKTNTVAASAVPGNFHLPLSHLCSQVAPEWLSSVLAFGSDPNQLTAHGVPLIATAMAAQAERLRLAGHDLLTPHASLFQLGKMLRSHGTRLAQQDRTGSPPIMLLALNGYCAAAETLLSIGADCNATLGNLDGNCLMHYLAAATHRGRHALSAFFLLTLALRHGGDLDQPNVDGTTARSLVTESLSHHLRICQTMITSARQRAERCVLDAKHSCAQNIANEVPDIVAALLAQANRLNARGHNPLLPHESLLELGESLQRNGMNLEQRHRDGTPPIVWLTQRGYCGAAEVLLALCPNINEPGLDGSTLMHALAEATRESESATLAEYMLSTALRYGGDPTVVDQSGTTPLSLLPADRRPFIRDGFTLMSTTRQRANETVIQRRQAIVQLTDTPVRHSAAFT